MRGKLQEPPIYEGRPALSPPNFTALLRFASFLYVSSLIFASLWIKVSVFLFLYLLNIDCADFGSSLENFIDTINSFRLMPEAVMLTYDSHDRFSSRSLPSLRPPPLPPQNVPRSGHFGGRRSVILPVWNIHPLPFMNIRGVIIPLALLRCPLSGWAAGTRHLSCQREARIIRKVVDSWSSRGHCWRP